MNPAKILIWGEFPPNTVTGISVSNQYIYNILKDGKFNVEIIEEYSWNKSSLGKINSLLKNSFTLTRKSLSEKIQILYFNIPLSIFGLIKILLMLIPFRFFSYKSTRIGHLHRGDFKDFISKRFINRILLRIVLKRTNKIIVLSDKYVNDVKTFSRRVEVLVLHNTSSIQRKKESDDKTYKKEFVCISNYIESKGIKELVQSFSNDAMHEFSLDIYGNIYESNFYKEIENIKSNNVHLNDAVDRDELEETLDKYDCLILPSWNEGQPIIVLEAMSLGIPVIATSVGDIPNMLGDDYKLYANPKDIPSLEEAILRFDKTDQKSKISEYLLERYHSKYSNDSYKSKVLDIFATN